MSWYTLSVCLLAGLAHGGVQAGEIVIVTDVTAPIRVGSPEDAAQPTAAQRSQAQASDARQSAEEFVEDGEGSPESAPALTAGTTYYRSQDAGANAAARRNRAREYIGENGARATRRCNAAASSVGTIGDGPGAAKSAHAVERNNQSIGNSCP